MNIVTRIFFPGVLPMWPWIWQAVLDIWRPIFWPFQWLMHGLTATGGHPPGHEEVHAVSHDLSQQCVLLTELCTGAISYGQPKTPYNWDFCRVLFSGWYNYQESTSQ